MIISQIVAVDKNMLIGNLGTLPWHIPEDLKRFRNLTMGRYIIMGRTSYELLPNKLFGRKIIVLSKKMRQENHNDIIVKNSVDSIFQFIKDEERVFVCGGASVYREFLNYSSDLFITFIDKAYDGDAYYLSLDEINKDFKLDYSVDVDSNHKLKFTRYFREKKLG